VLVGPKKTFKGKKHSSLFVPVISDEGEKGFQD
jgi:hypothetical protein